ncbi:Hypothetical protein Minf_0314 [Methylacidiphilum infernorum V4]|uniref:Uncharacterized protein n=1 Tax=Methylacidiphilum infernorum (isolate V4) TaxID=481448 RepID=B3DY97_METI4|nr:Hypothetical protein Minf_0314 [Methylacidiphilum infernorum V4]
MLTALFRKETFLKKSLFPGKDLKPFYSIAIID